MTLNLSVTQAVDLWSEFERGYRGESSFAGNKIEVYAYRLVPYRPGIHGRAQPEEGSLLYDDWVELGRQAADSLRDLLLLFREHHEDTTITVEGPHGWVPVSDWVGQHLHHRVHVRFESGGSPRGRGRVV